MREVIALVAERTDPDLGGEIHATERVEDAGTCLASKRRVRECGDVGVSTDRRDRGGYWDHALASFNLCTRPDVPGHTDSIDSLWICRCHLRHVFIVL